MILIRGGLALAIGLLGDVRRGRVDTGRFYYIGLAVVALVLVVAVIWFYRVWSEIREEEEPDSPEEILESLREAYEAGELDEGELRRVEELLTAGGAAGSEAPGRGLRVPGPASGRPGGADTVDRAEPDVPGS